MSFKDYIQERSDPVEQGKPVIPAAVLAGFTGECTLRVPDSSCVTAVAVMLPRRSSALRGSLYPNPAGVFMFGSRVGEDTKSHPLPGTGGGGVGEGTEGQTGPGSDSHSGSLGM